MPGAAWSRALCAAGVVVMSVVSMSCGKAEQAGARAAQALPPLPPPAPGAVFPLRVEPGVRHLVDASGRPFLIVGDAAWSILLQLTPAEIDTYLEDRHRRGYNTVLVNLLEAWFAAHPPSNREGIAPFLTPARFESSQDYIQHVDFGTPDDRYFALFDHLVAKAAEQNMLVMVVPTYAGYLGEEQGWWVGMKKNGASKMREFGRYLGRRYRGRRNLMWVHGGDYDVPDKSLVRELANGIRELDAESLHSFHGGRGTGAFDWMGGEPWLTVGNVYTGEVVYEAAERHYSQHPGLPFFLVEAYYEGAKPDPRLTRVQAYQALLSGASGQISGHDMIWQFKPGWPDALANATARSMSHAAALFESRRWWTLQPDLQHTLLTDGLQSGVERALAALAEDRSFAIAYTPSVRALHLDTTRMAGPRISARWMDPQDGSTASVAGPPLPRSPTLVLQPPGTNSAGQGDWVLVLESVH
ncbi:MAG TPA: DUF4038 domain-containing protein [Albitalea sp.]|uniref:apiosidase-like domain-containing protein n=1 Tax=Piscinibacter sp. TaxID=1903157 RepID=UPI002ECFE7DB